MSSSSASTSAGSWRLATSCALSASWRSGRRTARATRNGEDDPPAAAPRASRSRSTRARRARGPRGRGAPWSTLRSSRCWIAPQPCICAVALSYHCDGRHGEGEHAGVQRGGPALADLVGRAAEPAEAGGDDRPGGRPPLPLQGTGRCVLQRHRGDEVVGELVGAGARREYADREDRPLVGRAALEASERGEVPEHRHGDRRARRPDERVERGRRLLAEVPVVPEHGVVGGDAQVDELPLLAEQHHALGERPDPLRGFRGAVVGRSRGRGPGSRRAARSVSTRAAASRAFTAGSADATHHADSEPSSWRRARYAETVDAGASTALGVRGASRARVDGSGSPGPRSTSAAIIGIATINASLVRSLSERSNRISYRWVKSRRRRSQPSRGQAKPRSG